MDNKEFERFNNSPSKSRGSPLREGGKDDESRRDRHYSDRDTGKSGDRRASPPPRSELMSDDDRDRRREFSSQDWERNRDRNLSGEYSGMKRDRDHFESHDRESPPRKRRRDDWVSEEGTHSRGGRRSNGPPYEERSSYSTARSGRNDWDENEESFSSRRDSDIRERESASNRGGTFRRSNWLNDLLRGPFKSYQQFCDYFDEQLHPHEAKRRYEEYKREYNKKNSRSFFEEHMKEEWFKEKYHPTALEKRRLVRIETARKQAQLFAEELLQKTLNTNINADDYPELLPYTEKGEGHEDVETFEETHLSVEEKEMKKETDTNKQNEPESSEKSTTTQPTQTAVTTPTQHPSSETTTTTTTTTPARGIDELKSETQTNTEIQQITSQSTETNTTDKNNKEGESGKETESELKVTDTTTTSPKDKENKESSTPRSSRQQNFQPRDLHTLFIKTVPPTCSRDELLNVLSNVQGGELKRLILSYPNPAKHFHRVGWVTYTTEQATQYALKELSGYKMKDFELMLLPHRGRPFQIKITPAIAGVPQRVEHDLGLIKKLVKQLDREKGILPEDNILLKREEEDLDTDLTFLQRLDRYIAYLRRVHCFCYYCGEEYIDADDVLFRCGEIHLRGTEAHHSTQDPKEWEDMIDSKINQRIDKPDNPDFYTGKSRIERYLDEFYASKIFQLEEAKFRCELCCKLFRGAEFVKKHLHNKHPTEVENIKQRALQDQYYENYMNDPKRILPSHSQPPQSSSRQHPPLSRQQLQRNGQRGGSQHQQQQQHQHQQQQQRRGRSGRGGVRSSFRRDEQQPSQEHLSSNDPRGIINYSDLDAPKEEPLEIDFTKVLKDFINEKNKLRSTEM